MFALFLWSFVSGLAGTLLLEVKRDIGRAQSDLHQGAARARKQREIEDLIERTLNQR
ncbi:MAG: hypothetical protein ACO32I_02095 [Candidatus Limnocylindrus sp.]|jgi:hypothetical protein